MSKTDDAKQTRFKIGIGIVDSRPHSMRSQRKDLAKSGGTRHAKRILFVWTASGFYFSRKNDREDDSRGAIVSESEFLPTRARSANSTASQQFRPRPVHIMDLDWLREIADSDMDGKAHAQTIICRLAEAEYRQQELVRAVRAAIDRTAPKHSTREEAARRRYGA